MTKNTKIIVIMLLLFLENFALVYIAGFYKEYRDYKDMTESNSGLTKACKSLVISDSLYFVLQKMKKFVPTVRMYYGGHIYLSYGVEWSEEIGTALLFDKDYKLSHKSCNDGSGNEFPRNSIEIDL